MRGGAFHIAATRNEKRDYMESLERRQADERRRRLDHTADAERRRALADVDLDELHHQLESGFYFPHHSHDSLLQLLDTGSLGTWAVLAWIGWVTVRSGSRLAMALCAAVLVGALTQDVLGDREVLQALALWLGLALADCEGTEAASERPKEGLPTPELAT